jgi:hypothetical protein
MAGIFDDDEDEDEEVTSLANVSTNVLHQEGKDASRV